VVLEQGLERGQAGERAARGKGEQDRNQSYREKGGEGA
jgi:hypothetical protein